MIGNEKVKTIIQGPSMFGAVIGNNLPKETPKDAMSVEIPSFEEIRESMKWPATKPLISQKDASKFLEAISKIMDK